MCSKVAVQTNKRQVTCLMLAFPPRVAGLGAAAAAAPLGNGYLLMQAKVVRSPTIAA